MNQHKFSRIDSKLVIPENTRLEPAKDPEGLAVLVQRYLNGESVQDLAKENQVNRKTIYNWMLSGLGDEHYHDVVTTCLVNRIAESDQELDEAVNPLHIARAREKARFSRMDYERRRPALYGQKQEVTHKQAPPTLSITIVQGEHTHVMSTVSPHPEPTLAIEGQSTVVSKT